MHDVAQVIANRAWLQQWRSWRRSVEMLHTERMMSGRRYRYLYRGMGMDKAKGKRRHPEIDERGRQKWKG